MGGLRNAFKILFIKPEWRSLLEDISVHGMIKIKVDPQQIEWEGMVWVYLDQNKGQWKALVEMVMSFQLP